MEPLSLQEMNRIVSDDHDRRVQDYTAEEQDFIRMMMQSVTEQYQNKKASGAEDIYAQWDQARGAPLPYKPREYASLQPMEGQGAQSFMPFARPENMYARETRLYQPSGSVGSGGMSAMSFEGLVPYKAVGLDCLRVPAVTSGVDAKCSFEKAVVRKDGIDTSSSPETSGMDAGDEEKPTCQDAFLAANLPFLQKMHKLERDNLVLQSENKALQNVVESHEPVMKVVKEIRRLSEVARIANERSDSKAADDYKKANQLLKDAILKLNEVYAKMDASDAGPSAGAAPAGAAPAAAAPAGTGPAAAAPAGTGPAAAAPAASAPAAGGAGTGGHAV
jgi:hypothetical protein